MELPHSIPIPQVNGIDRFKIADLAASVYPKRTVAYVDNFTIMDADGMTVKASDSALNTTYDATYTNGGSIAGLNGGTGFGPWEISDGNLCVNLDTTYAVIESPLPFETAFLVAGSTSTHNIPARILDAPLDTGDTFSMVLKKMVSETAGSALDSWLGVNLYNSDHFNSADARLFFGDCLGTGSGNWSIWNRYETSTENPVGFLILDTGIRADDTPIRVEFTVTGEETYDMSIEVWDYETGTFGTPQEFNNIIMTGTGLGPLDCFRVQNMKGRGDLLFDDIIVSDATNPQIPGDANNDGKVDGSDVTILANNWQHGVTTSAAAVPEPGMLVMLLLGASLLYVFRIRSK